MTELVNINHLKAKKLPSDNDVFEESSFTESNLSDLNEEPYDLNREDTSQFPGNSRSKDKKHAFNKTLNLSGATPESVNSEVASLSE
jgi:hypothetical protein